MKKIYLWVKAILTPKKVDNQKKIAGMIFLGVIITLEIIMGFVPDVGFIAIAPFALTTMLIPVTIVAVLFNWFYALIAGLVFGIISLIKAYQIPIGLNYLFQDPLIALVPRMLAGLFIRWFYLFFDWGVNVIFNRSKYANFLKFILISLVGCLIHALLVWGFILMRYYSVIQANFSKKGITNFWIIFGSALSLNLIIDTSINVVVNTPVCLLTTRALSYNYYYTKIYNPKALR